MNTSPTAADFRENSTLDSNLTDFTQSAHPKRSSVADFLPVIVACLAVSLLCLLCVAAVYGLLAEFKNLHGRIVLSLSGNLAVTYTLLLLDLSFRKKFPAVVCLWVGYVVHFTFLATFFWTNVMAYDVWRTLSRIRPKDLRSGRWRYLRYSAYAWGATLVVSLPALLFDRAPFVPAAYRPKMGIRRCWLSGTPAFLIYFNGPVGLVLLANLFFFLMTVRTLVRIGRDTVVLQIKKDKQRFYLYVKLFLIMGLIWTTEFVPWLSGEYRLYAVAGILNSLHGVYLFAIFVCKRSVFRSLRELLPGRARRSRSSDSGPSSRPTGRSSIETSTSVFYCNPGFDRKEAGAAPG